jgi:hypothetical protein
MKKHISLLILSLFALSQAIFSQMADGQYVFRGQSTEHRINYN